MIRRPPRSTLSSSSAASDVYKRQTHDWDRYDTRHAVFRPARMNADQLEQGYWGAYRDFYRWSSIWKAAFAHGDAREHARHLAYTGGWKKLEPMWDLAIRSGRVHA